jgi:hypothetical protein
LHSDPKASPAARSKRSSAWSAAARLTTSYKACRLPIGPTDPTLKTICALKLVNFAPKDHGCLRISVHKSSEPLRKIEGWAQAVMLGPSA